MRPAAERLRPQSRKTCRENPLQPQPQPRIHKAEKHVALQKSTHSPSPKGARRLAARGRTVASTNQENMSRKSPATATATFAFTKQKNMSPFRKAHIRHPPKRSAPLHAARGRTVASTNQENMSRKSPATASTKQKNMSPFRKAHIRHPPKERAASCGSRSNGCVHKSGKHVAKIPCNRNRNRNRNHNRLDDCSCLLLICYRTDGNIVWVLRKS